MHLIIKSSFRIFNESNGIRESLPSQRKEAIFYVLVTHKFEDSHIYIQITNPRLGLIVKDQQWESFC